PVQSLATLAKAVVSLWSPAKIIGVPQLATYINLQELLEATHPLVYSMTRDVTTANREDGDGVWVNYREKRERPRQIISTMFSPKWLARLRFLVQALTWKQGSGSLRT
ncbi:unnamed protein product, partial [Ectocarpus sp. 13 AM-2016]